MKFSALFLLIIISLKGVASITADYNASAFAGCSPLVVSFSDNSTQGVTNWSWDFGNGNTSTIQNPSATFNYPGLYNVRLLVSNGTTTDTVIKSIRVFQPPTVAFQANDANICLGTAINFTNNVTPGDAPVNDYAWGFGNGISISQPNVIYTYQVPGIYNVTLVVQDTNGCAANYTMNNYITVNSLPNAAFSVQPAISCGTSQLVALNSSSQGAGLTYQWNLPDTTIYGVTSFSHMYYSDVVRQRATLIVVDQNGCSDTLRKNVSVWDLHGEFTASKLEACVGEPIAFNNASNLPGNSWRWDFGDGTNATTKNSIKTYNAPGIYTVSYIIRQDICVDTVVKVDYITIRQSIIPSFGADTTISCQAPLTVNFNNTTPGGVQYLWEFGDGTTSTQENPSHVFTNNNSYTVTLTVIDSSGCPSSSSISAMIQTAKPKTRFKCDTLGCPGVGIKFINQTPGYSTYLWDFGDGSTSTVHSPIHAFSTYGSYVVSLTATNANGCDSTVVKTVHIDTLEADFSVNNTFSPCPPFVAIFQSTVSRPNLKYYWNFGDGTTDTVPHPTHIYFHPGIYTVSLIVRTNAGCTDTVTYVNLIEVQGPSGTVSVTPTIGCSPLSVNLTGTASANTLNISWDLGDGVVIADSLNLSHVYTESRIYHPRMILTDHIGCTVPYDADSITVLSTPVLELNDTTICAGNSVTVNLGTDSYQWIPATNVSCAACGNVTITPDASITYHIIANSGTNCAADGYYTIDVTELPQSALHQKLDVCYGNSVELSVNDAANTTWMPASFLNTTSGSTVVCTPDSSITYIVESSNALGCSVSSTVEVNVIEPFSVVTSPDTSFCSNGKVELRVDVLGKKSGTYIYDWSNDNLLTAGNIANPTATVAQTTQFTVTVTNAVCNTSDVGTVNVSVYAPPAITSITDMTTVKPLEEVKVGASADQPVTFSWQAVDELSCTECQVTILTPQVAQYVKVTATASTGCSVSDSVLVQVEGCPANEVFVPNAFTPNGDGNNDDFMPYSNILAKMNYLRVFDRWGIMVYEGNDINSGWGGDYRGEKAQPGVYVYVMQAQCANGFTIDKKGSFTLLR